MTRKLTVREAVEFRLEQRSLVGIVDGNGQPHGAPVEGAVEDHDRLPRVRLRQGLGTLVTNAVINRDAPVVQGVVLVAATMYVLVNLIVDALYAFIDPRIRY